MALLYAMKQPQIGGIGEVDYGGKKRPTSSGDAKSAMLRVSVRSPCASGGHTTSTSWSRYSVRLKGDCNNEASFHR